MSTEARPAAPNPVVFSILFAISFSHLLNDTIQSLLPAIYPLLKDSFRLDYVHIGLITLTFQMTASILQLFVGIFTARRPLLFSLALGRVFSLTGPPLLASAQISPAIVA